MTSLLEVQGVSQHFRVGFWLKRAQILKDVSLVIPEKSVFGFLGANGAGKTTLIHLLTGLRRPKSGIIRLRGLDICTPKARSSIGYLPERPYFHEHLTGRGLLRYFGTLSGLPSSLIDSRIPKVLAQVNLLEAADLELKRYSKGMLQRIGIAQAILHDPEFLILDEPMSGLDPLGRKEIRELILSLAADGKTIFFSTHVIHDVETICDQVALISKGTIRKSGSVSGFLSGSDPATEILVRGTSAEAARSALGDVSVREIPDGIRIVIRGERDLNSRILSLIKVGGQIESVSPIRPSLEDLFGEVGRA